MKRLTKTMLAIPKALRAEITNSSKSRANSIALHQAICENCNTTDTTNSTVKIRNHNDGTVLKNCYKCGVPWSQYKRMSEPRQKHDATFN